ncbi:recombinase family protein [Mesorhizobium sp. L48C026A00]|uniref:recombinase family protein n=1 Tax=Mesorhizobium sp. L48C026A00 TaxID=1287182 RepID=UPI001FD9D087|nr:recombinase family protein [Mesorhizobium sp. L48C026A00]
MNDFTSRHTQNQQFCMTRIGYARTSTTDQNLSAQIAALKAAGCEVIREEQKSGASLEGRPQLNTILDFIHPGETLVVTRIDRLARSLRDLQATKTGARPDPHRTRSRHLAWNRLSGAEGETRMSKP